MMPCKAQSLQRTYLQNRFGGEFRAQLTAQRLDVERECKAHLDEVMADRQGKYDETVHRLMVEQSTDRLRQAEQLSEMRNEIQEAEQAQARMREQAVSRLQQIEMRSCNDLSAAEHTACASEAGRREAIRHRDAFVLEVAQLNQSSQWLANKNQEAAKHELRTKEYV